MTLVLYQNKSAPNVVNKKIENATGSITAKPVTPLSVTAPVFIVDDADARINYNYCKVTELGNRYYYCNMVKLSANRLQVNCTVDVLQSYADGIKACTATVVRSESIGTPTEVVDEKLPIDPNTKDIREMRSNNPFTIGLNNYVLTTLKGGGTIGN